MAYINPQNQGTVYHSLEDLVVDLVTQPNEMFMHDKDCEAIVYIPELGVIQLLGRRDFSGSDELRKEELNRELIRIKGAPR